MPFQASSRSRLNPWSAFYRLRPVVMVGLLWLCSASALTLADQHAQVIQPTGEPVQVISQVSAGASIETVGASSQPLDLSDSRVQYQDIFKKRVDHAGWALLIPLFGITFLFGGPVLVVIVVAVLHYRSKARRIELRAQIVLKALEAGRELPEAVFPGDEAPDGRVNLRRGVRNLGLGFAILLPLGFLAGFDVGSLGLIPMSIGVAQLCLWRWVDRPAAQG